MLGFTRAIWPTHPQLAVFFLTIAAPSCLCTCGRNRRKSEVSDWARALRVLSAIALLCQLRLVILLKSTDFGLAVRNSNPDIGKVPLHEMWDAMTASSLAAGSAAMRSISFCP
jgi:hypothetical protein